jgi:hypothetical protein
MTAFGPNSLFGQSNPPAPSAGETPHPGNHGHEFLGPDRCKSCGAPILWGTNLATGKSIPLDAHPIATAFVVTEAGEKQPFCEIRRAFRSHFVSCPNRDQHRTKGNHHDQSGIERPTINSAAGQAASAEPNPPR